MRKSLVAEKAARASAIQATEILKLLRSEIRKQESKNN